MTDEAGDAPSTSSRALTIAALIVGAIWAPIILFWADAPFAITFDDAWYYFEIARNIVDGHGSTFDTLNETNGYHPLWMVVCSIAYVVGLDGMTAVRVLLVVQLACWVGALAIVARLVGAAIGGFPGFEGRDDAAEARRRATFTVAAVIVLVGANPYVIKTVVNGLESGLVVLTQAAVLAWVWRHEGRMLRAPARDRWILGALLGLAFLARTDAVLLIGAFGLWTLVEAWTDRPAARAARAKTAALTGSTDITDDSPDIRPVRAILEAFALPAITIVGWLAFSAAVFGDPRQVSGELKRLPLTGGRLITMLVVLLIALLIAWRARARVEFPAKPTRVPRVSAFFARTGWYVSFCLLIVAYYQVLSAQQWLWYYAPVVLYLAFLAPLAAVDFCEGVVAEAPADRPATRAMLPVQAILLGVLALALGFQLTQITDPNQRSIQLANREAGEWISANLADDAVLASWDAGVVGYFTDQPVINLDGVVNSFEWLDAKRDGTTDEFLRRQGLQYTVNHAGVTDGEDAGIRDDMDRLLGEGTGDGAEQVSRFEFTYSGSIEGQSGSGDRPWAVFIYSVPPAEGAG